MNEKYNLANYIIFYCFIFHNITPFRSYFTPILIIFYLIIQLNKLSKLYTHFYLSCSSHLNIILILNHVYEVQYLQLKKLTFCWYSFDVDPTFVNHHFNIGNNSQLKKLRNILLIIGIYI